MPSKAMMKFTTVNGWRKSTVSLLPVVFVLPFKLTGDGFVLVFAVVLYASSALRPLAILAGTVSGPGSSVVPLPVDASGLTLALIWFESMAWLWAGNWAVVRLVPSAPSICP